jgi:hypothetical protein
MCPNELRHFWCHLTIHFLKNNFKFISSILIMSVRLYFSITITIVDIEVEVILLLAISHSVGQYVLVSGTPLGHMTRFFFFFCFAWQLLCSSSWGTLSDKRTGLSFVVQSVSGQSRRGLITIHYIWDYWLPFPSPLTTRRDYGGSILTRLHKRMIEKHKISEFFIRSVLQEY